MGRYTTRQPLNHWSAWTVGIFNLLNKMTMTTTKRTYFTLEKPGTITEIPIGIACPNARYVFDQPVTLLDNEYLELNNGQFFHVMPPFSHQLEGRWKDGR